MLQLKSFINRSNKIQKERNKLIEQFLFLLKRNQHDEGKKNT